MKHGGKLTRNRRPIVRKNRAAKRPGHSLAAYINHFCAWEAKKGHRATKRKAKRGEIGIDPTKPVMWTRSFYTYTPGPEQMPYVDVGR